MKGLPQGEPFVYYAGMIYDNGFQTLYGIDDQFIRGLEQMDSTLIVWQDPMDEYFYLAYARRGESMDPVRARRNYVRKIRNAEGGVRKPDMTDLYALMWGDLSKRKAKELVEEIKQQAINKEEEASKKVKETVQEGLYGAVLKSKNQIQVH